MVAQGATPQPSPTVQPHPHTKCHQPTTNSTHRAATRPPSHNKVKHQPPCFCHHAHTQAVDQQGSHTKRHMVMVMVASVVPHHKPVVSHGSSHVVFCLATTHSQVAHTRTHADTRDSGRRCGGKHGVDETTHTPHHEHHALKPKWQAHTMPSQWLSQSMVHCALACVCGQATCCTHTRTRTHTGKWRDHRSQAANTQATTNNHHTNTHQTSLMVVTHTQAGHSRTHQGQAGQGAQQDQGSGGNGLHSDHAMAQACNTSGHATMACAPSPRATHASGHVHTHPLSHNTHTRGREKRSWERGHKEWRGTVA